MRSICRDRCSSNRVRTGFEEDSLFEHQDKLQPPDGPTQFINLYL